MGVSIAALRLFGIYPDVRDLLMMVFKEGIIWSNIFLKTCAGRGSRLLDLMGEFFMIFSRSEAVMVLKLRSLAKGDGSTQTAEVVLSLRSVRWWWILAILPLKKSRNSLSSSIGHDSEAWGEDEVLCKSLFMRLKRSP